MHKQTLHGWFGVPMADSDGWFKSTSQVSCLFTSSFICLFPMTTAGANKDCPVSPVKAEHCHEVKED